MGSREVCGVVDLLVAVYAATLGIPAQPGMDYAGNEPHHLLAAESLVSDRDVDLSDEYRERAYASWYPGELKTDGRIVDRRLVEPHGVGFALLIAPAYALGGARAVQWQMLAMLALAFVLAAALARRMVPEPWATVGRRAGRALPARGGRLHHDHAGDRRRGAAGGRGAVRAGDPRAAAAKVRGRRRAAAGRAALARAGRSWPPAWSSPGRWSSGPCASGGASRRWWPPSCWPAPWSSTPPSTTASTAGITPRSAGTAVLPDPPFGYIERLPRLVGLWLDREVGLLRWAPLIGLAFFAAWLLVPLPPRPARARGPGAARGRGHRRPAARGDRRATGDRRAA